MTDPTPTRSTMFWVMENPDKAAARIAELEETLAFYADFDNHCGGPGDTQSEVFEDNGRRACAALGVRYTGDDLVNPRQET